MYTPFPLFVISVWGICSDLLVLYGVKKFSDLGTRHPIFDRINTLCTAGESRLLHGEKYPVLFE